MDVKSLRDREFNKRVRDVVSRDQNRLRETFDKYDKQCAERMAEIHHMQEKVRFSMRSLAMDKIHISQNTSAPAARCHRRSSESRVQSDAKGLSQPVTNKRDDDGQQGKQTKRDVNEYSKRHRASVTSMFSKPHTLDIPSAKTTNRRASSPFAVPATSSQSPKQPYFTGSKPAMSSSCPVTDGYMTLALGKTPRSQTRTTDNHNMLSVNDMRMTTKSPVINLRRKSADEVRGIRKVPERNGDRDGSPNRLQTEPRPQAVRQRSTSVSNLPNPHINSPRNQRKLSATGQKGDRDCSPNRLQTEPRPQAVRQRSTSVSNLPNPHVNSPRNQRKLSATGQKVQLFRTRSNSLPDLLSPDSILTATKEVRSSEDIANKNSKEMQKSKPIQMSGSTRSQENLDNSPLARSFEEMRHCRYLRCCDTEI